LEARQTIDRLEAAIQNQMEIRHYQKSRLADLIIFYRILVDQQVDYRADNYPNYYDPYTGYATYRVRRSEYDQGTLSIEMKDDRTDKLVWQGSLDFKIKSNSKLSQREIVDQSIALIFDEYPFRAGNSKPSQPITN